MNLTLPALIQPWSEDEFRDLLRTRTLCFQRTASPSRMASLLDWATLRGKIESGDIPPDALRVTRKTELVPAKIYTRNGKVHGGNLDRLLEQGASLYVVPLERHIPALAALCSDVAARIPERIYTGAIATTGHGGAAKLHHDPEDLLILQLEGSKRWLVYGAPVTAPFKGHIVEPPLEADPVFDEVLRPGDVLFLPAGYWHRCENGSGLSLHAGIFIEPAAAWHDLRTLLRGLLDEELMRVPLTRFAGPEGRAAHERAVKVLLTEMIARMPLGAGKP